MTFRFIYLLDFLLLFTLLMTAGCASFPGNELPKRGYDGLVSAQPAAVVDYDVNFINPIGERGYSATYFFSERVKAVFEKSGVFVSQTLDGKGAPVHLSLKLNNSGSMMAATLAGIVGGLSLTVIPVFATDMYELNVDVCAGDKVIKSYAYHDHMTTWIQLFLIFAAQSHKPANVVRETIDNMLLNFLYDASADGVFSITDHQKSGKKE